MFKLQKIDLKTYKIEFLFLKAFSLIKITSAYPSIKTEPGFLDTTEEVYALDNEDATLECFFTGHPTPKITWMQDDDVLSSDDHFIISVDPEAGKATLLVKGVTYDDIGEYECIAVNDKGYADCRLYLDVAG